MSGTTMIFIGAKVNSVEDILTRAKVETFLVGAAENEMSRIGNIDFENKILDFRMENKIRGYILMNHFTSVLLVIGFFMGLLFLCMLMKTPYFNLIMLAGLILIAGSVISINNFVEGVKTNLRRQSWDRGEFFGKHNELPEIPYRVACVITEEGLVNKIKLYRYSRPMWKDVFYSVSGQSSDGNRKEYFFYHEKTP